MLVTVSKSVKGMYFSKFKKVLMIVSKRSLKVSCGGGEWYKVIIVSALSLSLRVKD